MKLYYAPGACSLASHIVAREAGIDIALEQVDTRTKRTTADRDFLAINPKGYVPTLEIAEGEVLTEGAAILQFLADSKPTSGLAPIPGTLARSRLHEALSYVSSELHKSYSPLFNPATPEEVREERKAYLRKRYALVDQTLAKQPFMLGEQFSVADAYLFTVTQWAGYVALDLSDFPALEAFQARVRSRPAVQAALQAEGLMPAKAA